MKPLMTIPKKRELQKHQKVSGGFLLPVLLPVLLVFSLVFPLSYSKAEEATSSNLLSNQGFQTGNTNDWTKSGNVSICSTCGPHGGKAAMTDKVGGTLSQSHDLFDTMTQDEINNGFDITYGSDVKSHTSNTTVPVCSGVAGQDCKDTFSITLSIKDSVGNILQEFEHEYKDINWSGWDNTGFDFTSTVPSNSWSSAIATLKLYGIDEGFTGNGYGGPVFDNTHMSVTYTTQAALDVIAAAVDEAMEIVNQQIDAATDIATEPQSFEVTINDPIGNEVDSFTIELPATETNMGDQYRDGSCRGCINRGSYF